MPDVYLVEDEYSPYYFDMGGSSESEDCFRISLSDEQYARITKTLAEADKVQKELRGFYDKVMENMRQRNIEEKLIGTYCAFEQ